MISLKLCRNTLLRLLVVFVIISSLAIPPAFSQESEDSQVFIAGFNAYQQKDYASAIVKMNEVLQKYPDTPLRDMALFWLSRSYFKAGNQNAAARYLSQFSKEYPDNPLKGTVEEELLTLTARYEKGEKLPDGSQAAQKAKTAQERLAAEKAEAKRAAAEKKEQERLAAVKADQDRKASEQSTKLKADQDRLAAAAAAESARVAELKQAEEKAAAEKIEQERLAAAKAEQDRIAAEQSARLKAENDRIAALKAEEARLAVATAEAARVAALRLSEEKAAAEKMEQERLAAAKAEQERIAAEQITKLQSDKERIATVKAEEARRAAQAAAEKKEQERLAVLKADQERISAEQTAKAEMEKKRITALKEEEARLAVAAAAAESARIASLKLAEDKAASEKKEQERLALAKAEQARVAAAQAENARLAAAESARVAAIKQAEAKASAEKKELERLAAVKDKEEQLLASQRAAEEKVRSEKKLLREKAIAQYKSIIDKYPGSTAAASAAAKLRELGLAVALPQVAAVEPIPENAQILRLEVAQYAGFEFNLLARPEAFHVAQRVNVPFEITNRGNGNDAFYLESAFPAEFKARFSASSAPDAVINQTPELAQGETFKGVISLVIPAVSIDGLRIVHPVKAASRLMAEASQSREIRMIASAPLLRAVLKADKTQPLPGEKIIYRIALLNVGSTAAKDVTFRLSFPPQLEPVDYAAAGFKQEMKSALVFDGLQINSGESRELSVAFQLKDDSLAGQELATRAELINNQLSTTAAFVSNMAYVQPRRAIHVRTGSERIMVIPGQTISVPFVVTNNGNVREKFRIASILKGTQDAVVFHDTNRDAIRQASEPVITEIGPLAPREEASIVVEIKTPRSAGDGSEGSVLLTFNSEGDTASSASGSTQLVYSRPVLQMTMAGRDGRLKPGEVASFDLAITNKGSNLARVVELQSAWPEELELVAADPANSTISNGNIIWRFKEMGAAEKRSIKVSFRVKSGTGVGTSIQVKNILTYEDQLGNRY